jgi:hypothetical protein
VQGTVGYGTADGVARKPCPGEPRVPVDETRMSSRRRSGRAARCCCAWTVAVTGAMWRTKPEAGSPALASGIAGRHDMARLQRPAYTVHRVRACWERRALTFVAFLCSFYAVIPDLQTDREWLECHDGRAGAALPWASIVGGRRGPSRSRGHRLWGMQTRWAP